jgi:methionyl aminopeptidase
MSTTTRHTRDPLQPGVVSGPRAVPASIPRPEYVGRPGPTPFSGSEIKTPETIERIRVAARLAAQALQTVGEAVAPGVTTDELDRIGHEFLLDHGAYPSTLGYRGFPKSLCTSLNEVICHGIPDSTVLAEGDIVNIDITAFIGGVHGDNNATFAVGEIAQEDADLIERTREALARGIAAVKPGREPGMVFTIEPMLTLGTHEWVMWDDGWTVLTKDGSRTAQFEHTLLVTETGTEILTLP